MLRHNQEYKSIPLTTAWPYELCPEMGSSCEILEECFWSVLDFFKIEDLLDGRGGRRDWELFLWCSSVTEGGKKGFDKVGNTSGVCLLVRFEEKKELPILDNEGVPKKWRLGDGTLL